MAFSLYSEDTEEVKPVEMEALAAGDNLAVKLLSMKQEASLRGLAGIPRL